MNSIKYLSICGMLGYGYPLKSLEHGILQKPAFIAADNGSSDPGPYYLGSGTSFVKKMQIKRDLEPALIKARQNNIPLIIGSAGGAGAKPHVDFFLDILLELASKNNLHFKLAVIYADLPKTLVSSALKNNKISPCGPVHPLTQNLIDSSTNLVAQMGTEPIINALDNGADVIIVGRCCDTAIFAALPIKQGFDPALALHSAKIAECGALCAKPVGANDSLIVDLRKDHFIVTPANAARKCHPATVSAHSLYEQPNPDFFIEPEGKVNMTESIFEQVSDSSVKVSGTKLEKASIHTVKLEAAQLKGYRTITIAGISDPIAIKNIDSIIDQVKQTVSQNLNTDKYQLYFRCYGSNAVTPKTPSHQPREIGLLIEAVAQTQELADTVLSLARSTALHQSFPNRKATAGNLAFPFSPSDFPGGPVYEFSIYHLMRIENESDLFPVTYKQV